MDKVRQYVVVCRRLVMPFTPKVKEKEFVISLTRITIATRVMWANSYTFSLGIEKRQRKRTFQGQPNHQGGPFLRQLNLFLATSFTVLMLSCTFYSVILASNS